MVWKPSFIAICLNSGVVAFRNIASLNRQIAGIDKIKQGVVPLMYKMIDTCSW